MLYLSAKASLNSSLFRQKPSSCSGKTFNHPEAPLSRAKEIVRCCSWEMNELDQEFQTFFEHSQYAYKKHSSTVTALIQVIDSLKLAVDQKQYSVATFIDLRKAFDIIDHRVFLERLKKYGFGEIEANWICSHLTDRQQYVVCNGVQSQLLPINYGVPQGSALDPSQFCLLSIQ